MAWYSKNTYAKEMQQRQMIIIPPIRDRVEKYSSSKRKQIDKMISDNYKKSVERSS